METYNTSGIPVDYQDRKGQKMNETNYNTGYDALTTIIDLCNVITDNPQKDFNAYTLVGAIKRIAINSRYLIYIEQKEKANN